MRNATKSEEDGRSAAAMRERARCNEGVLKCGAEVADGNNGRRHKEAGASRIRDLREGEAGLAQLAIEEGFFVLQPGRSGPVDVA